MLSYGAMEPWSTKLPTTNEPGVVRTIRDSCVLQGGKNKVVIPSIKLINRKDSPG